MSKPPSKNVKKIQKLLSNNNQTSYLILWNVQYLINKALTVRKWVYKIE